jgi:hypothetical protein
MKNNPFEQFVNAASEDETNELKQIVHNEGYPFFRRLLDGFDHKIKQFTDNEAETVVKLIAKAKKLFPDPGQISPSWERVWIEFEQMIQYKIKMLQSIAEDKRDGDWQVVMDNPYTNQEVVCYPGLSFLEAAYLYSYFRPGLEKNEYVQVQKVKSLIMEYGS